MTRLITFSTIEEARDTIQQLECDAVIPLRQYSFDHGVIIITGMGPIAAAAATARAIAELDGAIEVWNLGICGALTDRWEPGTVAEIREVSHYIGSPVEVSERDQRFGQAAVPTLAVGETGACLMTTAFPVHQPIVRNHLAATYDLVDMEGYGVAFAAQQAGKLCKIIKIVSDLCNSDGPGRIREQLPQCSKTIASFIASL